MDREDWNLVQNLRSVSVLFQNITLALQGGTENRKIFMYFEMNTQTPQGCFENKMEELCSWESRLISL